MSETVVTVEDAAFHLTELVDRVSGTGEPAILVKAGRPVARIVPMPDRGERPEGLIDFLQRWRAHYPEPDEGFAEAIEESRRGVKPAIDPWE